MKEPNLRIEINKGPITAEPYPDQTPATVANFLEYVDAGPYNRTIFHRVSAPIKADNGLKNKRSTLAMARTMEFRSATAQFFINHKDNAFLDHKSKDRQGWGYAVCGKVTDGMEIMDEIAATPTGASGPFSKDVPKEAVVIEKITRLNG